MSCPNCRIDMVLKKGRYGVFWGCSNYPKCKCSIDAGKKKIRLKELELVNIDFDCLIESGIIDEIVTEVIEHNKKAKEIMQGLSSIEEKLNCNNLCYKVLEYLDKNNRYIDISKFVYSIYRVRGELPNQFKFWINNSKYSTDYLEKDVKTIILKTWEENIFSKMSLELIGEEIFIGDFNAGGGKVDIMAQNKTNDCKVIIEVKGPKGSARGAWGQINLYIATYKKFDESEIKGMIVAKGYPFGVYEKEIIFVGYVIESNKIAFIFWN